MFRCCFAQFMDGQLVIDYCRFVCLFILYSYLPSPCTSEQGMGHFGHQVGSFGSSGIGSFQPATHHMTHQSCIVLMTRRPPAILEQLRMRARSRCFVQDTDYLIHITYRCMRQLQLYVSLYTIRDTKRWILNTPREWSIPCSGQLELWTMFVRFV